MRSDSIQKERKSREKREKIFFFIFLVSDRQTRRRESLCRVVNLFRARFFFVRTFYFPIARAHIHTHKEEEEEEEEED